MQPLALLAALMALCLFGQPTMAQSTDSIEQRNKALVRSSFDAWRAGTGSPYELLADDVTWTIVGHSAASRTYPSKEAFLSEVIRPFNARMSVGLKPAIRDIFAEGRDRDRILRRAGHRARRQALCEHLRLVPRPAGRQDRERVGLLRQHRVQRLLAARAAEGAVVGGRGPSSDVGAGRPPGLATVPGAQ